MLANAAEIANSGLKSARATTVTQLPTLTAEFAYFTKREKARQARKRLELVKVCVPSFPLCCVTLLACALAIRQPLLLCGACP